MTYKRCDKHTLSLSYRGLTSISSYKMTLFGYFILYFIQLSARVDLLIRPSWPK